MLKFAQWSLAVFPRHSADMLGTLCVILQDEDADDASNYDPFQFMLQFMLQPLLVASAGMPAGATAPALIKMCKFLKRTADTAVSQMLVHCSLKQCMVAA